MPPGLARYRRYTVWISSATPETR